METDEFLRQRALRVKEAFELFEVHKDFPATQVQILERTETIAGEFPEEAQRVRSEARLAYLIRIFDAHAEAYIDLIDDIKHQKAYWIVLDEYMRKSWEQFTGMPVFGIPHESIQSNSQIGSLEARFRHWIKEGYRRLIPYKTSEHPDQPRRGYRDHIRTWMKVKHFENVGQAAKHLGISESTLKSIMSEKGKARYGPEGLERVLKATGYEETKG